MDDSIDVQGVRRDNLCPPPVTPSGLSEGCIALQHPISLNYLREILLQSNPTLNTFVRQLKAYGTIKVYSRCELFYPACCLFFAQ
ncbi:DUF2778 domain-containing protein [Pantoea deleyi]|uniref:DUF2778 domain-containing protein n=1 Tax=Pantoea deleyi TaxID=470932 RepID=A0A506QKR7_9GAMM|nr:DUF2778 domain-containing protein [Pantoea deleyi]